MTPGAAADRCRVVLPAAAGPMPVDIARPARLSGRLAVVAHGRNGAPDQPQIGPLIGACLARGCTVLAPHLGHSAANAGAGAAGDFTIAGQIADLGAVLGWARQARADLGWTQGGALMLGHSMGAHAALRLAAGELATPAGELASVAAGEFAAPAGGLAGAVVGVVAAPAGGIAGVVAAPAAEVAAELAGEIAGVVAVAPVVSGAMLLAARRRMGPAALAALLAEVPGAARDWPAHDLIPLAPRIAVPVAVIVGADDAITPPADARLLADALPDLVAFDVLAGAHHCPLGADYARSIAAALDRIDGRG